MVWTAGSVFIREVSFIERFYCTSTGLPLPGLPGPEGPAGLAGAPGKQGLPGRPGFGFPSQKGGIDHCGPLSPPPMYLLYVLHIAVYTCVCCMPQSEPHD